MVTPLTPKAVVAEWTSKEAEIVKMSAQANSVSQAVPAIDWSYWQNAIKTPGVVDQLKKEYEGLKFPVVTADTPENTAKISSITAELEHSKREAVHAGNEVKEAAKVAAAYETVKKEGLTWTRDQWYAFIPGLREQHLAEHDNEDYIINDEEKKASDFDFVAAKQAMLAGQDIGAPELTRPIGDLDWNEEQKLMDEGRWSIARMLAGTISLDLI